MSRVPWWGQVVEPSGSPWSVAVLTLVDSVGLSSLRLLLLLALNKWETLSLLFGSSVGEHPGSHDSWEP